MINYSKITNYEELIETLKLMKSEGASTREILEELYLYYKDNVTYNYDQLQIVKLSDYNKSSPSLKCAEVYDEMMKKIGELNDEMEKKGIHITEEMIRDAIKEGRIPSKSEASSRLDEVFREVEGRPLTQRNKENCLGNYYNIVYSPYKPAKNNGIFKTRESLEHSHMRGLNRSGYEPVYKNGMLTDGVCSEYVSFEERICKDLGIMHRRIEGIGTTGHAWSMIYLTEEDRWVHFDMTMVRFYLDNWIKNHEPYKPEDWITASTEEIFKMQPSRRITKVGNQRCNIDQNYFETLMEVINEEVQK